jgi:hypothetical protein
MFWPDCPQSRACIISWDKLGLSKMLQKITWFIIPLPPKPYDVLYSCYDKQITLLLFISFSIKTADVHWHTVYCIVQFFHVFILAIGAVIIRLLVLFALYFVVKIFGRGLKFRGNVYCVKRKMPVCKFLKRLQTLKSSEDWLFLLLCLHCVYISYLNGLEIYSSPNWRIWIQSKDWINFDPGLN